MIATGVWVTTGRSSTPDPVATKVPTARAGEHSLLVGKAGAPVKVVVYEDFLCPFCRQLETSTRDFLHQDATKGTVQVEYRPFQLLPDDYSRHALDAWAAVLQHGTPAQALRFHDLLYDKQPYEQDPGQARRRRPAGAREEGRRDRPEGARPVRRPRRLLLRRRAEVRGQRRGPWHPHRAGDGKPLEASTIQDLADQLEKLAAG